MNILNNFIRYVMIVAFFAIPSFSNAQVVEINPLFEYPTAPEELTSIHDKSNYLMEHFWDAFDFKTKTAVDQNALNHAFGVYVVPMIYAEKDKALASANKLIEKISKNPTLLVQFTKAAEENLYSPRAEYRIDEVYLKFLDAITKNKKVSEARRERYQTQLNTLSNTLIGSRAPEFKFINRDGKEVTYFPMSTQSMLVFCDPTLSDWRMWRLKMESNVALTKAIDKGQVNIIFIIPNNLDSWMREVSNYSDKWIVGIAPDVKKIYDLRAAPSIYVIGSDGNIILKNTTPETAVAKVLENTK